jgi:hypothetical protein
MKNPVSLKQIVIDFIYIKEQLTELFKHEKQYHVIIDFLIAKDYLNDDLVEKPVKLTTQFQCKLTTSSGVN